MRVLSEDALCALLDGQRAQPDDYMDRLAYIVYLLRYVDPELAARKEASLMSQYGTSPIRGKTRDDRENAGLVIECLLRTIRRPGVPRFAKVFVNGEDPIFI